MPYVSEIKETFTDFPDTESIAVIVFFEGCVEGCKGCQNPLLQCRNNDDLTSMEDLINKIEDHCRRSNTKKIVFSGGDPYYYGGDVSAVMSTVSELQRKGYEVCVYTGKTFAVMENLFDYYIGEFKKPKYLKCGPYRESLRQKDMGKTDEKFVLASSNQDFYEFVDGKYKKISKDGVLCFTKNENPTL